MEELTLGETAARFVKQSIKRLAVQIRVCMEQRFPSQILMLGTVFVVGGFLELSFLVLVQ